METKVKKETGTNNLPSIIDIIMNDENVYRLEMSFFPRWGGKIKMVNKICKLIPEHETFMELYGGSGAVLLSHKKSGREVINEKDPEIWLLYKVITDKERALEFIKRVKEIKYDEAVFNQALKVKKEGYNALSEVERAVQVYILLTQSYNACMKTFAKKNGKDYPVKNYFNLIDVMKRLKDVEVYNKDAIDLIKDAKHDENIFLYLDPPYLQELRAAKKVYGMEMLDDAQLEMLKEIKDAECKIMLSGYRAPEGEDTYDKILRTSSKKNWRCYLLKEVARPGIRDSRAEEYIWVNYELPGGWENIISQKDYMKH